MGRLVAYLAPLLNRAPGSLQVPLMRAETGEVIGLMSFGLPPNAPIKQAVAAVSIGEIISDVEIR